MTTIINHRNVGNIYAAWAGYLATVLGSAGFVYWLQLRTPFKSEASLNGLYWCIGVAVVCAVLSLLFKYVFKREVIAWAWLIIVAWLGVGLFLGYGWHWGFMAFLGGSVFLLLITGPYLYFE